MAEISGVIVGSEAFALKDKAARSAIGDVSTVLDDILGGPPVRPPLGAISEVLDDILGGEPVSPGTVNVPLALPVYVRDGAERYAIGVADDEEGIDLTVGRE